MLIEYIEDDHEQFETNSPHLIKQLASLLKKIHQIDTSHFSHLKQNLAHPFNYVRPINLNILDDQPHLVWQRKTIFYADLLQMIMVVYAKQTLCHNDLHPGNLLFDRNSGKVYVVDWEFASLGDPWFDVYTIAIFLRMNPNEERDLINTYLDDHISPHLKHHLALIKIFVYLFWGMGAFSLAQDHSVSLNESERESVPPFFIKTRLLKQLQPSCLNSTERLRLSLSYLNAAFYLMRDDLFEESILYMQEKYASLYPHLNQLPKKVQLLSADENKREEQVIKVATQYSEANSLHNLLTFIARSILTDSANSRPEQTLLRLYSIFSKFSFISTEAFVVKSYFKDRGSCLFSAPFSQQTGHHSDRSTQQGIFIYKL